MCVPLCIYVWTSVRASLSPFPVSVCAYMSLCVHRTKAQFVDALQAACASPDHVMVVSYARAALGQTGDGHYAPVGGYDPASQMVLLLELARFKVRNRRATATLLRTQRIVMGESHCPCSRAWGGCACLCVCVCVCVCVYWGGGVCSIRPSGSLSICYGALLPLPGAGAGTSVFVCIYFSLSLSLSSLSLSLSVGGAWVCRRMYTQRTDALGVGLGQGEHAARGQGDGPATWLCSGAQGRGAVSLSLPPAPHH
jgi:hypothetical protein